MTLPTGSAIGNVLTQDEISFEGAPNIYIQDYTATPLWNPDSDDFYWGLSGTTTYPVYQLGCYVDVSLTEDVTMNAVRCDTVGDKSAVQKRNYLELNLTLSHLMPLSFTNLMLNLGGTIVEANGIEKVGIGSINNNKFYHVYLPKVYDDESADWIMFHLHRCQVVDSWTINMKSGENWTVTGLKIRAYADDTKPSAQKFGVIMRRDPSSIT